MLISPHPLAHCLQYIRAYGLPGGGCCRAYLYALGLARQYTHAVIGLASIVIAVLLTLPHVLVGHIITSNVSYHILSRSTM